MAFRNKTMMKVNDSQQDEPKKRKTSELILEKDIEILEKITAMSERLDSIDKNNKKFLMAATMKDDKTQLLEKENKRYLDGMIGLLDQIDVLLNVVANSNMGEAIIGLDAYYRKIAEVAENAGVVEIPVSVGDKFNPNLMESIGNANDENAEADTVVELCKKGYMTKENSNIIRFPQVTVNKK